MMQALRSSVVTLSDDDDFADTASRMLETPAASLAAAKNNNVTSTISGKNASSGVCFLARRTRSFRDFHFGD